MKIRAVEAELSPAGQRRTDGRTDGQTDIHTYIHDDKSIYEILPTQQKPLENLTQS